MSVTRGPSLLTKWVFCKKWGSLLASLEPEIDARPIWRLVTRLLGLGLQGLPNNFNRFMMGAVTLDIVGFRHSLMTFAKLGCFNIFGFIQKGKGEWDGTKIHVRQGLLKPDKVVLPAGAYPAVPGDRHDGPS